MTITSKEIKLLWGRAAGLCSICRIPLSEDDKQSKDAFPVGEQAHIVAAEPSGPRGDSALSQEERDSYFNVILLCPTHHAIIDKNVDDFPVERLHIIKSRHELWVQQTLSEDMSEDEQLKPISDLLSFVQAIKPILFWLYRTVPARNAGEFFTALNSFWSSNNTAIEIIDPMLTHGIEVLLRPITTDHFSSDSDRYSQGKLYAANTAFSQYFSDRGVGWRSVPRDSEPTIIIGYLTRNFEDLEQNQTLDEIESGIVRHALFILRYYQAYVRAFRYVDIAESLVSHFFAIIKPFLDQLGYRIPDALDESELFYLRAMCEGDSD